MLDFPATPTLNQQFTGGGSSWLWDGTAWNVVPQMAPATASDTPPANPAIGQMWWRSTNGQLYVWYDDGNTKQWVQTSTAVAPTPGAWELIYNGTFTCTSTSQFAVLSLGAFQKLKITFDFKPGVNDDTLAFQFSSDNGATWYTTSGDYTNAVMRYLQAPTNAVDGSVGASTSGGMTGSTSPTNGGNSELIIPQFNKAETKIVRGTAVSAGTTNSNNLRVISVVCSKAFAMNAIRFFNGNATTAATVNMLLEGIRG